MSVALEDILALVAALPGLYGFWCWVRRGTHAHRTAKWVKDNHAQAWRNLHWVVRLNDWAGVEVLIKQGLITGPEVKRFRDRDESLETRTWIGFLISAGLLLMLVLAAYVGSLFD